MSEVPLNLKLNKPSLETWYIVCGCEEIKFILLLLLFSVNPALTSSSRMSQILLPLLVIEI